MAAARDARSPLLLTLPASMRPFLLIFLFPLTANAWTPIADHQIADRAAGLAPRDLNVVIRRLHHQYAAGIELVIVNGRIVLENGVLNGTRAGRVLRRP